MNYPEGNVLTRFTTIVITIWEVIRWFFLELLQCIYFQNTEFRHRFSKYRLLTGLC